VTLLLSHYDYYTKNCRLNAINTPETTASGRVKLNNVNVMLISCKLIIDLLTYTAVLSFFVAERLQHNFELVKQKRSVDIFAHFSNEPKSKSNHYFSENLPADVRLKK